MIACEYCFHRAAILSLVYKESFDKCYESLLKTHKCTSQQQAGKWWNDEYKLDHRFVHDPMPFIKLHMRTS